MYGCRKRYTLYMILIAHIIIALASVLYTGLMYFSPTRNKLRVSYALVGLTVASGTWLIVANPAHMVQSCMSGLAYLCVVFFGIALARHKLADTQE